jgi:hypothetical protein
MTFEEVVDQAIAMLKRRRRVTYGLLKRQFNLDDDALQDLKEELIYGQQLAADEDSRLLVYLGWPRAHEDDAQRAVRTGLCMLQAMQTLNKRLPEEKGIHLAIRVGLHTGSVVVGEMGDGGYREQLALGETPNIASRVQGIAAPDTVI